MNEEKNIRLIGKYISRLYRNSLIYINSNLKEYGITSSEYMYIINIPFDETVNLSYLSHELAVDPALTTKVINKLVEKDLVYKVKSNQDKRAFEVSLTEKGNKLKPIICGVLSEWIELTTKGMEDEKKFNILESLEDMAKNIPTKN